MDASVFDAIQERLRERGAVAALESLVERLSLAQDFHRLFEARIMLARRELGLPLLARDRLDSLAPEVREALEDRLAAACRDVGVAMLDAGNLAGGFEYLQMIGETAPVREKIEALVDPSPEDVAAAVEIAVARGVHPERGIQLILEHYGLCQAVTACETLSVQGASESVREGCVRRLVRAIHAELSLRIEQEIERREQAPPSGASLVERLVGRDWLFEDDNYHIDASHLNAIVRMARVLPACREAELCIELCEYGRRLSPRYRYPDPPPFEDVYEDGLRYFEVVLGRNVESGLARFRAKAEASDPREVGAFPLEVYLHLLRRCGRIHEAVEFASRRACDLPGSTAAAVNEICLESGAFDAMIRMARERGDPVSFAAALISASDAHGGAESPGSSR